MYIRNLLWLGRRMRVRLARRVGIGHAGGHGTSGVAAAHRTHVAGGEARHSSAGSNSQRRGTRTAGQRTCGSLRLHSIELAVRRSGDTDAHSGHVVGHIKRMLALARLHGAIARGFELSLSGADVEGTAIGGAGSGVFLQLLLHGARGCCRRRGCHARRRGMTRRRRRSGGLVAGGEPAEGKRQDNGDLFHGRSIVNRSGSLGDSVVPAAATQPPRYAQSSRAAIDGQPRAAVPTRPCPKLRPH